MNGELNCGAPLDRQRQVRGDQGPAVRRALDSQPAPERGDSVVEPDQPGPVGDGAAYSVVPYLEVSPTEALTSARLARECLTALVSASATTK
jgi:hypothetical protein